MNIFEIYANNAINIINTAKKDTENTLSIINLSNNAIKAIYEFIHNNLYELENNEDYKNICRLLNIDINIINKDNINILKFINLLNNLIENSFNKIINKIMLKQPSK